MIPPVHDWTWAGTVYLPVPGFPGYRAGNDGSVWSSRRHTRNPEGRWVQLKPFSKVGYPAVHIYRDGRRVCLPVHTVILTTFGGPAPAGCQCRHRDGDRRDPRIFNLAWGTPTENMADAIRHGTMGRNRGERCGKAKLKTGDIREIRSLREKGVDRRIVATMFGICPGNVTSITKRNTWGHVV